MSRKDPVSRDAFFTAADEIANETGQTPKLQQLRDRVGGSFTTLSPLLNEWKARQREQIAAVLEMPESVLTVLKKAGGDIWTAASNAAGERGRQIEENARAKIEAAETEATEYSGEVKRLETALEQATAVAEKSQQEAEKAVARVTELQAKNVSLETALSDKKAELDKAEQRYDQLQERFDGLQAELLQLAKGRAVERPKKEN